MPASDASSTASWPLSPQPPLKGTVVESVYVEVYLQPGHTKPFSSSTASVRTLSIFNRYQSATSASSVSRTSKQARSTQTLLQLMQSASLSTTQAHSASASPAGSEIVDKISTGQNASSATIALSIGLPLGVFCLGFFLIFVLLWLRRRNAARPSSDLFAKSPADAPASHQTSWKRILDRWLAPADSARSRSFHSNAGATIKYKISTVNPRIASPGALPSYNEHVQTPQKVALPFNRSSSSHRIEAFLYTKPPGLKSIQSTLDTTSAASDNPFDNSHQLPNGGKWTYESPLSRWFLTKSLYLQDQVKQPLKSSTVKLKELNILSRVSKNKIQSPYPDETSPILSDTDRTLASKTSYVSSQLDPLVYRSSSLKYTERKKPAELVDAKSARSPRGSSSEPSAQPSAAQGDIKPQFIPKVDPESSSFLDSPCIQNAGTYHSTAATSSKKKRRNNKKLRIHLDQIARKPLPLTPKPLLSGKKSSSLSKHPFVHKPLSDALGGLAQDELYVVIRNYTPRLMDEITVQVGEHVRLLAKHTDGWCLVEKCHASGSPLCEDDTGHKEIGGEFYLNESRGIIPGVCLNKVTG
ncbi:LAQU0S15e01200g1_1 [Lachancea quebecensis]|uniref:LAQU0S15e01200g1_1 n=1 Tax=Lachancea quebecensis TaxID=1654605 RepID=A0A0P1KVT2_9SACH|nr:LAQU0S15e01200g1_1 [Lachancea quebecensis]